LPLITELPKGQEENGPEVTGKKRGRKEEVSGDVVRGSGLEKRKKVGGRRGKDRTSDDEIEILTSEQHSVAMLKIEPSSERGISPAHKAAIVQNITEHWGSFRIRKNQIFREVGV
jgi:hypothetical protein